MTRIRWWLAGMAALLVVLLLAAWLERRTIAGGYIDDLLRQKQISARYTITGLGPNGQRLTNVVVGDPARPDLTADWIETETRLGWSGPVVTAIRAGAVRVRGRITGGRLSLGALDRLLPQGDGGPITLPDLPVSVADGRMRLDTSVGAVGLKLTGSGNLRSGFAGTLAAVAPSLRSGGCIASGVTGFWTVTTRSGAARFRGPTRGAAMVCGEWRLRGLLAEVDAQPGERFDQANGTTRLAVAEARSPSIWLKRLGGTIRSRGTFPDAGGELALGTGPAAAYGANAATVRMAGRFRAGGNPQFDGEVSAEHASLPARWRERLARLAGAGAGTPFGPLVDRLAWALGMAGRDVSVRANLTVGSGSDGWHALIGAAESRAASGARVALTDGDGITIGPGGARIDGTWVMAGGGLPEGTITVAQAAPGAPLAGTASLAPYRAGSAELALSPVQFRATPVGNTAFSTRATLSGPLGDGRVEDAAIALNGGWDGRGRLVLNPRCEVARFRSLSIAGLLLDPTDLTLCPAGRALVTLDGGRLGGGARIAAPRLNGTIGGSPLALAARGSELRFGDGGLRVDGLTARLGAIPNPSEFAIARLNGRIVDGGISGNYAGAGGRIGAVPLVMSEAAGGWRLNGGVLTLDGGLTVADTQTAAPRFHPLPVREIAFKLANGRIVTHGLVMAPDAKTLVTGVTIVHDLSRATGEAKIDTPGITFSDALKPEQLTPLTFGVVAGVTGTVRGGGLIRWDPAGVSSTGTFSAESMNLAAAFGPVAGLATRIHFTDLLALESAPGQVATMKTVNAGVAVENGVFRYQTLSGARIRVEGARWPLAGGELVLEPALLDFSAPVERRLTFRISGLDARQFLQTFDYDNLDASGTFDGVLPIVFDASGGRLENGRLIARDGGTLAYRGEISKENLGTWGNLAFSALRSLRYKALDLSLEGPLAGNIVTKARFSGVAQGEGTTSNFLIRRLANLPFVFNVKIEAPFRALIGSVRSFYDPTELIHQTLPQMLEAPDDPAAPPPTVQPPVSETKR